MDKLRHCLWKQSMYWIKAEGCPNPDLEVVIPWSLFWRLKEEKDI